MIVMSRHIGDSLALDLGTKGVVNVRILDVNNDNVQFEIDVPEDIPVHRREIYDAIRNEMTRNKSPR